MKQSLTYGFLAGKNKILNKKGNFHLFGCDIMFDTQLNAWFIEPNYYPHGINLKFNIKKN